MENEYYTVNEFAKLCDTTKDTILVYDRKGLLKPAVIGSNGYRYYKLEQYYDFYVIKAFQMAGASLNEISEQLKSNDKKKIRALLEAKRGELIKRQYELMQMQKFIEKVISQSDIIDLDNGNLHIKYCPEEYFVSMHADYKENANEKFVHSLETTNKLNEYIQARGYSNNILFEGHYIIPRGSFLSGDFRFTEYLYKIPFKANDPLLHTKPAGKYVFQYIRGSFFDLPSQFENFRELTASQGYKTKGDFYISHLNAGMLTFAETENVRIVSVMVE